MRYDLYCDESRQDLLVKKSSINENNRFVCIGGIMLNIDSRDKLKSCIKDLKVKHSVFGELKWGTVANNKLEFYLELIDLFFSFSDIQFRTVVIDANDVDNDLFNESDHELGYYKFYYQLIYHWINKNDDYFVFTDYKTNKDKLRLQELKNILNRSYNKDCIKIIQAVSSKESLILQLQNILMGAVGYKFNYGTKGESAAKIEVVKRIEKHLGHDIQPTVRSSIKFNIFKINLKRGIH